MGLVVVAVTVTEPGPALRASALAVGLLALTESGVVAGVVAVVLLRHLDLLAGGFDVDVFTLVVKIVHITGPP